MKSPWSRVGFEPMAPARACQYRGRGGGRARRVDEKFAELALSAWKTDIADEQTRKSLLPVSFARRPIEIPSSWQPTGDQPVRAVSAPVQAWTG